MLFATYNVYFGGLAHRPIGLRLGMGIPSILRFWQCCSKRCFGHVHAKKKIYKVYHTWLTCQVSQLSHVELDSTMTHDDQVEIKRSKARSGESGAEGVAVRRRRKSTRRSPPPKNQKILELLNEDLNFESGPLRAT